MKLKFLSLVAAVSLLVSCGTTYRSTSANNAYANVPAGVQNVFVVQYPDASNVVWTTYDVNTVPIEWDLTGWPALTANDYVVQYDMGGNKYYAWYDANGTWIGSTYALTNTTILPAAINTTLNTQFSGYTIDGVQRVLWKDRNAYELKMTNGDTKVKVLMDANGTILKQKTKEK